LGPWRSRAWSGARSRTDRGLVRKQLHHFLFHGTTIALAICEVWEFAIRDQWWKFDCSPTEICLAIFSIYFRIYAVWIDSALFRKWFGSVFGYTATMRDWSGARGVCDRPMLAPLVSKNTAQIGVKVVGVGSVTWSSRWPCVITRASL